MGKQYDLLPSSSSSSLPFSKRGVEWKKTTVVGVAVGLVLPIAFPVGHMLLFSSLWGYSVVDFDTCENSCWDTIFKGPYENGYGGYKHVYFNSTLNTAKMWVVTVLGVVFLYETFKNLSILACKGRLRHSMAALVLSSLHSHYYAWWMHWNYWNDEYYDLWNHQIFFTFTELASTIAVLANINAKTAIKPLPLIFVGNVALFHILLSSMDQFLSNVLHFQGRLHQVLRDISLMSTDVLQVALPLYQLTQVAKQRGMSLLQLLRQESHIWCMLITTLVMYIYVTLFPG